MNELIAKIIDNNIKLIQQSKNVEDFKYRDIAKYDSGSIVLIGMRQIGKTEYLKYRVNLIKNKEEVLYINLDSPWLSDIDFSNMKAKSFIAFKNALLHIVEQKKIKHLLIDEVQKFHDWGRFFKGLLDMYPEVTFVATGSDALELNNSTEKGFGRFKVILVGPLTFKEYASRDEKNNDYYEHLENNVFPSIKQFDEDETFFSVYEKQIARSNFSKVNAVAVLRAISATPGSGITIYGLDKQIRAMREDGPDRDQIKNILNFLVDSDLIIKIDGKSSIDKPTHEFQPKFYPLNWNLYKSFSPHLSYKKLDEVNNPRKGFVFENYVISNMYSSSHTHRERFMIMYGNGKVECDVVYGDNKYEIKSFDVENATIEQKVAIIQKAKINGTSIIHTGETKIIEGIQFINVAKFLKEEMWK